jgi:transcriptional regulator with XRE-family HTH domain
MHAGKKIRIIRAIKGISQQQLADRIGRTRSLVSNIEQTGKINYFTFQDILKVFKMTEAEFHNYQPKDVMKPYSEQDLIKENKELKEKLTHTEKELDMMKELIQTYKKYIQTLERGASE